MATCDPQALLNAANCFDCLTPLQLEQVQVQMLCDLVNGGLAGGPFVPLANINGTTNYISKFTGPNSLGDSVAYELGGFIGINTTAPATELQVVSTSSADPRGIMSSQYSTDTNAARLHLRKSRGTVAAPTVIVSGDILGRIRFSGYDGSAFLQMASIDVISTGIIAANRIPTYLSFSVATNTGPSVMSERMVIAQNGNVGIGINAPSGLLHVNGSSGADVNSFFQNSSTTDGNTSRIVFATMGTDAVLYSMGNMKVINISHNPGTLSSDFSFSTRGTDDALYIKNDGKIGIGTIVPKSKLDIVGNLTIGDTYGGANAAPTSGAIIEGDVGIGRNNPSFRLDIFKASNPQVQIDMNNGTSGSANLYLSEGGVQKTYIQFFGSGNALSSLFSINNTAGDVRIYDSSSSGIYMKGGQVGIGAVPPNANALLDLVSTTLGFKLPNMTSAQKNAIANTAGLMVFDTDLGKACVNNGAGWQTITSV